MTEKEVSIGDGSVRFVPLSVASSFPDGTPTCERDLASAAFAVLMPAPPALLPLPHAQSPNCCPIGLTHAPIRPGPGTGEA